MGLSFGLLAISVAVAATVLFVALPRVGTPGAMTLFLRFAAVSGVCAVGSSAMYFIYTAGGGIVSLVLGDVAMVLAPGLMLVALSVLDGRRAIRSSLVAGALALTVAIVTATVPLPGSLTVKCFALAGACGATAWAAWRSRFPSPGPLRLIALTNAVYALYCVTRVVVGALAGSESSLYLVGFSYAPATVLGASSVLLVGAAVVRVRFGTWVDVEPEQCPSGASVVIGDWELASAAYGPDRLRTLLTELRAAARELSPEAVDIPNGVEIDVPNATTVLAERLSTQYGWAPEQTILLVDGVATAAIRTHPARVRWFSRSSARS